MAHFMPDLWPWTIATAAIVAAIAATIKAVDAQRVLTNANKELKVARAEIAALKKRVNEQEQTVGDEFTKPLAYPKNHIL